jgi:hypothetical protein
VGSKKDKIIKEYKLPKANKTIPFRYIYKKKNEVFNYNARNFK